MNKDEKKALSTLQQIIKNVNNLTWNCLQENCNELAINSHLLQVNGILNHIIQDGHLYQIKNNDFFEIPKKGHMHFKKIGIKNAISEKLFCNKHDTNLFKQIECENINFHNYQNQLLFSYRSLVCEIRKKQKNIEMFNRAENAQTLNFGVNYFKEDIEFHKLGLGDLTYYKKQIEENLLDNTRKDFSFSVFEYPLIEICVSAVFSPIDTNETYERLLDKNNPLNNVFINFIPQKDKLILIIGYNNELSDEWIKNYISSWSVSSKEELENNLTNLLATKVETWSMSPRLYEKLLKENINKFIIYWNENAENLDSTQKVDFNLFQINNKHSN
jgi:hypothetical protein